MESALKNIRIIIIEPSGAGNVGSIARAMANFGIDDLVLVNAGSFNREDVNKFACHGTPVAEKIRDLPTFESAVEGADCIIGTTRRARGSEPSVSADEGAAIIAKTSRTQQCAIVFGREKCGLSKEEKNQCTLLTHIDTDSGPAGSLNISHAAAVFFYEIRKALQLPVSRRSADISELIASFDLLLKSNVERGQENILRKTFISILLRSNPLDEEVKRLARLFGKIAARRKET